MLDVSKIRKLREKRGLSQTDAAKAAGMSPQQWHNIETGAAGGEEGIKLGTLERVAKALGVRGRELLK